jgi:hypothetical protein
MPNVDTKIAWFLRLDNESESDTTGAPSIFGNMLPVALSSPLAYLGISVITDRHVLDQQPIRHISLSSCRWVHLHNWRDLQLIDGSGVRAGKGQIKHRYHEAGLLAGPSHLERFWSVRESRPSQNINQLTCAPTEHHKYGAQLPAEAICNGRISVFRRTMNAP